MLTIDAQVHCYERNHPGRPWTAVLAGPPEVTGPDMIKAMDEVGVDGALGGVGSDAEHAVLRIGEAEVRLTNLRKPFWPTLGLTKRDLLQYYADVSPVLLPHDAAGRVRGIAVTTRAPLLPWAGTFHGVGARLLREQERHSGEGEEGERRPEQDGALHTGQCFTA